MKAVIIAAAALFALPAAALALSEIEERFGNAPQGKQPGYAEGILDVVNLKSRVYFIRISGGLASYTDENFYYRGDARDLNETLRKFAAVKAEERKLVLLPGHGKTHSFDRKAIDFGWRLYVPPSGHAVLTVYIDAQRPRGAIDIKKARKWIGDLDSDDFQVRQDASRELAKLGVAAKPLLRETLKSLPSLEVRRRVESLLAKLKGTDADDLEIPEGVTVLTPTDWLESGLAGLSDTDLAKCNAAGHSLVELAPYNDKVVPALAGLLARGKGEYVRRVVASCLGRIGAGARTALPALKEGLEDPDKNIRAAFRSAIDQIEKAKDEQASDEEVKKRRALIKDLDEWKKARAEKSERGSGNRRE